MAVGVVTEQQEPLPRWTERLSHVLDASVEGRVGRALPRRSLVFDIVIMVIFMAMGALLLAVMAQHERPLDFGFVLAISAPLAIRRRFPRVSILLIFTVAIAQQYASILIGIYDSALLFGLYTAVGSTSRRFGLIALLGGTFTIVLGALTDWWRWIDLQIAGERWIRPYSTLGALILVFAAWALGERLRSARLGSIALAERAHQLIREREQQAELIASAERARIAREMHDVIAHGLSVMIAQADGASYVVDKSPVQAKEALEQISASGREALSQMRDLLGLLRTSAVTPVAPQPQPDLADLDALVEQARSSGTEVIVRREDGPAPSALVSLTAYRIIQEGLTNARKHGGQQVEVTLKNERDQLVVTVADRGRGGKPAMSEVSPGYGLIGMAERVAAVGGWIESGGTAGGGYLIEARLPLDSEVVVDRTVGST